MEHFDTPVALADAPAHLLSIRKALRLTQADVAARLGVSQSVVARLERSRDPQFSTVTRWAAALGRGAEISFPEEPGGEVVLSIDDAGPPVTFFEEELRSHTLLLGSTGSGRSATLREITRQMLDLDWEVVVIDLAGDEHPGGLRDTVAELADGTGHQFRELGSHTGVELLEGLPPEVATDVLMELTSTFDDLYWQEQTRLMLSSITHLVTAAHEIDPSKYAPLSVKGVSTLLYGNVSQNTKAMRAAVTAAGGPHFEALHHPSNDAYKVIHAASMRLAHLLEVTAKPLLANETTGDVAAEGITYLGFDGQRDLGLSRAVCASVLRGVMLDLRSKKTAVVISAAELGFGPHVEAALTRARAAGVAIVVSSGAVSAWGDADLRGVAARTNVWALMRQGEVDAATVANLAPQSVTPAQLRSLGIGEAVVKVGGPVSRLELLRANGDDSTSAAEVHGDDEPVWQVGAEYSICVDGAASLDHRTLRAVRLEPDGTRTLEFTSPAGIVELVAEVRVSDAQRLDGPGEA